MIKLTDLLQEQDSFTATSKKSGETVVFKSKDARDSALKAGTHSKIKDSEDGDDKKDTPKVNIFKRDSEPKGDEPKKKIPNKFPTKKIPDNDYSYHDEPKKDKEEPKSKPNSDTPKTLPFDNDTYGEIEVMSSFDDLQDFAQSKEGLSDEQRKQLQDLSYEWEDAEGEMVMGGDDEADAEYQRATSKITAKAMEVVFGPEDNWEEPKSEPSKPKLESDPQAEKVAAEVSKKYGITPEKMGEEDFKVAMGRAVYSALQNSNFHSEARELIAVLEDKPELSKRPDYPSIDDDDYQEKMDVIRQKYASTYTERDDFSSALGRETSDATKWDGVKSVGTLTKQLRDNGMNEFADKIESIFDKKENISTKLMDLLPESIINEGTRSQVGVIGRNGKIVSAYVHYDGYPSNMKPGLKHHMKSDKDVLKLIKMGGARGIFDDKEIEYYKNGKPTKGDMKDFGKYVDTADRSGGAEYIYLYNMKDKKWYFADVYGDKKLKKLF